MRNAWKVYLDLINLEEEIDILLIKMNREMLITEKERLGREIDKILAKELELKHKLERIEIYIDKKKKKK